MRVPEVEAQFTGAQRRVISAAIRAYVNDELHEIPAEDRALLRSYWRAMQRRVRSRQTAINDARYNELFREWLEEHGKGGVSRTKNPTEFWRWYKRFQRAMDRV